MRFCVKSFNLKLVPVYKKLYFFAKVFVCFWKLPQAGDETRKHFFQVNNYRNYCNKLHAADFGLNADNLNCSKENKLQSELYYSA